jgi:hypothetical protein
VANARAQPVERLTTSKEEAEAEALDQRATNDLKLHPDDIVAMSRAFLGSLGAIERWGDFADSAFAAFPAKISFLSEANLFWHERQGILTRPFF